MIRVAEIIEQNLEEFTGLECLHNGKPWADAEGDI